jgi:hypothetical protein
MYTNVVTSSGFKTTEMDDVFLHSSSGNQAAESFGGLPGREHIGYSFVIMLLGCLRTQANSCYRLCRVRGFGQNLRNAGLRRIYGLDIVLK